MSEMSDNTEKELGESRGWEGVATTATPTSGSEPKKRGRIENLTARGRPKGLPNKLTRTFKEAAERAFEKGGGVEWLVGLMHGTASDRAAVLGLFGRLIPAQLQAQVDTTVRVELNWLGNRGIGRVTDADVRSLDVPQNIPSIQGVIEGEIIDQASRQPIGNHTTGQPGASEQYIRADQSTNSPDL